MINYEGFELRHFLIFCSSICLGNVGISHGVSIRIAGFQTENRTQDVPNIDQELQAHNSHCVELRNLLSYPNSL